MIVISSELVTAAALPGATIDLDAPIFGYENFVVATATTATTAAAGYPATNLTNVSTASFWRAANTTTQYLTSILNPVQAVDYVGIARHNFKTAGVAVSVERQASSGAAWVEVIPAFVPANNQTLILRFPSATTYGIRVKLVATIAPAEAAVFYAGSLLVSTQRIYVGHSPITLNRQTQVVNGQSESGNYLGRIITGSSISTSVSLTHLKPDWYREYFDPFVLASQATPFFFGWRPQSYPAESGYSWLTNNPSPTNMMANGMMQVTLEVAGVST